MSQPAKRKLVLIADDDRALVHMLSIGLKKAGYEVIAAVDGYFAFSQALNRHPDLLILDIHMPAASGFNVLERMYKSEPMQGVPVIYMSGDNSPQVRNAAEQFGAFALVHKPFDVAMMLQTVDKAMKVAA